jgi:hypothetical protein
MSHEDCCKYREALEDMVDQFAYRCSDGQRRWFTTGGLSALEHAFAVLGWDDPHYVEDGACEIAGCEQWSTCVGAYPRSLARPDAKADTAMVGFGFLCSPHMSKWNGPKAESAPDLGRAAPGE